MTKPSIPSSELQENNEAVPWYKSVKGIAVIAGGSLLVIGGVVYYVMSNKGEKEKPKAPSSTNAKTKTNKSPSAPSKPSDSTPAPLSAPSATTTGTGTGTGTGNSSRSSSTSSTISGGEKVFFARNQEGGDQSSWNLMSFNLDSRSVHSWDNVPAMEKSEYVLYNNSGKVIYRTKNEIMALNTSNTGNSPQELFKLGISTAAVTVSEDGKGIGIFDSNDRKVHIHESGSADNWSEKSTISLVTKPSAFVLLNDKKTLISALLVVGKLNVCVGEVTGNKATDSCEIIPDATAMVGISPDGKHMVYPNKPGSAVRKIFIVERNGQKKLHEIPFNTFFTIHKWVRGGFYFSSSADNYMHKVNITTGAIEKVLDSNGKEVVVKYS